MGCWNGTCAVSNLPITEDKRAVLIPLLCRPMGVMAGGAVDEAAWYASPIGLPIRGVYDTYGNISIDEGDVGEAFFMDWVRSGVLLQNGAKLRSPIDEYDFWRALEQGEIARKSTTPLPLGFVLVLESVFDALVAAAGTETVSEYPDGHGEWIYEKMPRKDVLRVVLRPDAKAQAELKEMTDKGQFEERALRFVEASCVYASARDYLIHRASFISIDELLSIVRNEAAIEALNNFLLFQYAFSAMRKTWAVCHGRTQSGLGDTGHLYRAVAAEMLAAVEADAADDE